MDILETITEVLDRHNPLRTRRDQVTVEEYPFVHQHDLVPVTLIKPNLENGPWIAGGACLQWLKKEPVGDSDIDIFFKNDQDFLALNRAICNRVFHIGSKRFETTEKMVTENAATISLHWTNPPYGSVFNTEIVKPTTWMLQLIKRKYFNNVEDLLASFDLTICKIATDGHKFFIPNEKIAADIKNGVFDMTEPLHPNSMKRFYKYYAYGYTPAPGLFDRLCSDPNVKWVFDDSDMDEYNGGF